MQQNYVYLLFLSSNQSGNLLQKLDSFDSDLNETQVLYKAVTVLMVFTQQPLQHCYAAEIRVFFVL